MLNDLFYAVLGMLPWTCALIAALLVLRHFARAALSARFFRLIALRRENPALVYGAFRPVFLKTKRHADVFCYFRVLDGRKFYVECNLTAHQTPRPAPLSGAQAKRIGNYAEEAPVLRPYEANVYEVL